MSTGTLFTEKKDYKFMKKSGRHYIKQKHDWAKYIDNLC